MGNVSEIFPSKSELEKKLWKENEACNEIGLDLMCVNLMRSLGKPVLPIDSPKIYVPFEKAGINPLEIYFFGTEIRERNGISGKEKYHHDIYIGRKPK